MIRVATPEDIPFLLDLARDRYTQEFDARRVEAFLRESMRHQHMLVLRSERGALVANIVRQFWGGPVEAYVLFIACRPGRGLIGDGVPLVRAADAWRRNLGGMALHFGEETGINLEPLARRVGAVKDRPSYIIRGGAVNPVKSHAPPAAAGSTLLDRVLGYPNLIGGRPELKVVG